MVLDDSRIFRALIVGSGERQEQNNTNACSFLVKPYRSRYSYAGDFHETPEAAYSNAAEIISSIQNASINGDNNRIEQIIEDTNIHVKELKEKQKTFANMYTAAMSIMHPYALIRLTGTSTYYGEKQTLDFGPDENGNWRTATLQQAPDSNLYDKANVTRWYEIMQKEVNAKVDETDTNNNITSSTSGTFKLDTTANIHYAKDPTTKDIINWGNDDEMGRFPYAFQDFVFCKYWNRIENNRMITLRRYPAPILDNVVPANFKNAPKYDVKGHPIYKEAFSPLATAVTYFGEGTDNSLKELLKFTVGYNWSDLNSDIHNTSSTQIDEGQVFSGGSMATHLNSGLGALSTMLGILGDFSGEHQITPTHAAGLPPDPYQNGPYENRVIGPVNVIMSVKKRDRGLKFEHDSLTLTFDYVSRPISYVNNKAIMLDLLANIMTLTYSTGLWFGGAHKYRQEHPAMYPWRNLSSLNKIYQGKLFGKNSAYSEVLRTFFNEKNQNIVMNFASSILEGIKAYAKDIVNAVKGAAMGKTSSSGESSQEELEKDRQAKQQLGFLFGKITDTAGRVVAAHLLKGANIPWLDGARALLTGEPVGDWHLTIGNPLNPIAMIGNLIVDNCEIEFYDEMGPDDFPIGFKARISLKHGMGRDKDTVESMFNRGNGRIYVLSDAFKSSADRETTVDEYTGVNNALNGKVAVANWGALQTTGSFAITKSKLGKLKNNFEMPAFTYGYDPTSVNYMKSSDFGLNDNVSVTNLFRTTPWAMHHIL